MNNDERIAEFRALRNHKYKKNAKKDSNGERKVKDLESVEAYLARHTNIVTEAGNDRQ